MIDDAHEASELEALIPLQDTTEQTLLFDGELSEEGLHKSSNEPVVTVTPDPQFVSNFDVFFVFWANVF